MLPNASILPRRWFVIAAILAMILAAVSATLMFHVADSGEKSTPSDKSSPSSTTPTTLSRDETFSLIQRSADGQVIAWGSESATSSVLLEVGLSRPERYRSVEIHLWRNGVEYEPQPLPGVAQIRVDQLPPGGYQWSAILRGNSGPDVGPLIPPRATPSAIDFIIPPPVLALRNLRQARLDGTPITAALTTEAGARLGADVNYPGAILEVEVKAKGKAFDESNTLSSPVSADGTALVTFQGPNGGYRWRCRAIGSIGRMTQWKEMHFAKVQDFVIVSASARKETKRHPRDRDSSSDLIGDVGQSMSGGLARGPSPSVWRRVPPLWSYLYTPPRLFAAIALIVLALAAGYLRWRLLSHRPRTRP